MKVFITGSTGRVGSGVLQRCLAHPEITSIIALTRRPLDTKDPKLNNIIHKDYHTYPPEIIEQLKGAEACIWALGSPTSGREVHIDYTRAALSLCRTHLVPALPAGKTTFRFVYTSGGAVPYLDSAWLFFLGPARKLRGEMDREILKLNDESGGDGARWESYVARPWYVVEQPPVVSKVLGENSYIFVKELGAAMVEVAMKGCGVGVTDNAFMKELGREALEKQPN